MASRSGSITVKAIQSLLARVGSVTTGKREALMTRLSRDVEKPKIWTTKVGRETKRILSVDMGIKNLAFCVADVTRNDSSKDLAMSIEAWRRLDVTDEVMDILHRQSGVEENADGSEEADEPFAPAALSLTAYNLIKNSLLTYDPDIILIERQRWRSSGGSAIQQWTVRVNTFEGMLWAILTALRAEATALKSSSAATKQYEVFAVDPKRVGNFWVGDEVRTLSTKSANRKQHEEVVPPDGELNGAAGGLATKKTLSRGKVEKKAKISLVRSWLAPTATSSTTNAYTTPITDAMGTAHPSITFTFSKQAETTRQALCSPAPAGGRRSRKSEEKLGTIKLDDVADCLLQAAAFVVWEASRESVKADWEKMSRETGAQTGVPSKREKSGKAVSKKRPASRTSVEGLGMQ
jgi:cruciform cutting endonuclease 1